MSRRRKSAASAKKSKDDTKGSDDWSKEEKTRLLDALKRDDGENNWRSIARQVNTKTVTQVKQFAAKLQPEKRAVNTRNRPGTSTNKRPIAPKDDGPLEGWINATKRLRGDDNIDGTCIPQSRISRAQECQDSSGKKTAASSVHKTQDHDSDEKEEDQQVLVTDSDQHQTTTPPDSNDDEEVQKSNSILEDLLTNQKHMMQKIALLDSKLENLRSDDSSAQSSVMDMLIKINNRLDSLANNTPHGCCGGPVIIQTTPRANVIHQPILDTCSSCSDAKQDKRHQNSIPVSGENVAASKDRSNPIFTNSFRRTLIPTSSNAESIVTKNTSGDCPTPIIVLDSQEESLSKSQTITPSTSSLEISSCLPNVPSAVDSSVVSVSNPEHLVNNVSCVSAKATTLVSPNQQLPVILAKEQFPRQVVQKGGSLPNGNGSAADFADHSSTITTTANTKSLQAEVLAVSRQQRDPVPAPFTPSQQTCALTCKLTESSPVAPVHTTPAFSVQSSYIDLQSTLTASPIMSTVIRSTAAKHITAGTLSESSRPTQRAEVVASSSISATPSQKLNNGQSPRIPLHSATTTSAQTSVPPGFITLSHTANVIPSSNKDHGTPPLQPQTIRTNSRNPSLQGKDLYLSPAAGAVIQKAANDAGAKQKIIATSPKEIMNAAMLISNYVTEHPNPDYQAQWQSCLSSIVTDYHKNLNPSRGDLLQLVSIGYNPYVVLTQYEIEDMMEKSKGRPKFFALRLAEKLYGIDVLIKSTPYGIGGKAALHPVILDAIKVEVLRRFAADMSIEAQTALWKGCVTSIAQRCKRARNPRKDRSSKRMSTSDDELGPPSMAVGGAMQCDEHEDYDDSDEEDEDCELGSLDQPVARHMPPLVRIPSDDEQESSKNGSQEVVLSVERNELGCIVQAKDSRVRLESSVNSSVEDHEPEESEQNIPPGIDPDITVVHLPSNLQDQRQSSVVVRTKSVTSSCRDNSVCVTGEESARINAQQTVRVQEPCEGESDDGSPEKDASPAGKFHGDFLQMVRSFPKPGASTESVIVSGIKMTPDYSHVLVGGNPNVVVIRQKYLDALTKSSQPTHFSVRLAELVFGDDVLEASTVTGGKRGTMQLDPIVINAIQIEVTERFLKTLVSEQQSIVLRKCVTSIATRCKTLRYNRSRTAENNWKAHPSQISTE